MTDRPGQSMLVLAALERLRAGRPDASPPLAEEPAPAPSAPPAPAAPEAPAAIETAGDVALLVDTIRTGKAGERKKAIRALAGRQGEAVGVLIDLLGDGKSAVRQAAADGLRRIGKAATGAIDALLPVLADPTAGPRRGAAAALQAMGKPGQAALARALDGGDATTRRSVLERLDGYRKRDRPLLLAALADPEPCLRALAVQNLGAADDDDLEVTGALLAALGDPAPEVRREAGEALEYRELEGVDAEAALGPLLAAIDSEADLAPILVPLLGQLGEPARGPVLEMAGAADAGRRANAALALGHLGADGLGPLLELLDDGDRAVGQAALEGIASVLEGGEGRIEVPAGLVDRLAAGIDGPAGPTREACLRSLACLGPAASPALPRILELACLPDAHLAIVAALALAPHDERALRTVARLSCDLGEDFWFADDEWMPRDRLRQLLGSHPEPTVRALALRTLATSWDDEATADLRRALADTDPIVRARALEGLHWRDVDDLDPPALLVEMAGDDDPAARAAALGPLASIDSDEDEPTGAAIYRALADPAPAVRLRATLLLTNEYVEDERLDAALTDLLADPDHRPAILSGLEEYIEPSAACVAALEVCLDDERAEVRLGALRRILESDVEPGPRVVEAALAALTGPGCDETRRAILEAIPSHGEAFPIDRLLELLGRPGIAEDAIVLVESVADRIDGDAWAALAADDDPRRREAVAWLRAAPRPIRAALVADPDPSVRRSALLGLGDGAGQPIAPEVAAALDDDDPAIRLAATLALRDAPRAAGAPPALVALADDPDRHVRQGALQALGHLAASRDAAARAALRRGLAADEVGLRIAAAAGLVEAGPLADEDRAALAADPDPIVRRIGAAAER